MCDKRLSIGLMVSDLNNDFDKAVVRGVIRGAEEIDANLVIFPGRYINGVYADKVHTQYEYQHNTLFSYAYPDGIDVLLVLAGTIANSLTNYEKRQFLKGLGNIPVITIACDIEGYPSVCFDEKKGLTDCIEHLINKHKCRNIGFVSGPRTNEEALARLAAYKAALKKHGIPFDEDKVVFGRFSPYCQEEVRTLLDKNEGLEAIVFANDGMAGGAYEVFAERGIAVGKDLYITGFDDAPLASNLVPPLTTVRADAAEMGCEAALGCAVFKEGGNGKFENILVPSSMVKRNSCGCRSEEAIAEYSYKDVFVFNHCWCRSDTQTVSAISKYLFEGFKTNKVVNTVRPAFERYLEKVFRILNSDNRGGIAISGEALEMIPADFEELLSPEVMVCIDRDRLCSVIDYLDRRFAAGLEAVEDREKLSTAFVSMYRILMRAIVNHSNKCVEETKTLTWQTNNITKDMLLFDSYDDSGYGSVTDKLKRLNMQSSYIYVFPETITHKKDEEWFPPTKVMLKSYHNGDVHETVPEEEQEVSVRKLFCHKYMPRDRRYTMVLSPIFIGSDHYGLFLCEPDYEYFYCINALTPQLCSAFRILRLIQDKDAIQQELEHTLAVIREKNIRLDEIAKADPLTGVYNRRGFFMQANNMVSAPANRGKEAMIVFADLDSLKTINDSFSHEDGDFAIKNAAKILRESFRSSDVIGRIGGDEFSVLAMVEKSSGEEVIPVVRERIKAATDSFNATHDKPYIVHMSVGAYTFKCGGDVELSKILAKADDVLYDEKKKKKSILR